jgi:hypothetical protein
MPVFLVPHPLENIAGYEQTLIGALQSEIRVGDRVTVGGGEGVTAVVAAQAAGETGPVVCFEGSGRGVRKVKATGIRNKMSRRLTVKHAVVGEADQRLRRSEPACDARCCPGGTARMRCPGTGLRGRGDCHLARYDHSPSRCRRMGHSRAQAVGDMRNQRHLSSFG